MGKIAKAADFCNTVAGEFLDLVSGDNSKTWVLGFGPVLVPAAQTVSLTVSPQCWFKGTKLVCNEDAKPVPDKIERTPARIEIVKPARWWRKAVMRAIEGTERRIPQPQPSANGLFLVGLFVGNRPQLPSLANPISLFSFSPLIEDSGMKFDECAPALVITIQVANLSEHDRTFSAVLRGTARVKKTVDLFRRRRMS